MNFLKKSLNIINCFYKTKTLTMLHLVANIKNQYLVSHILHTGRI